LSRGISLAITQFLDEDWKKTRMQAFEAKILLNVKEKRGTLPVPLSGIKFYPWTLPLFSFLPSAYLL